MLESSEKVFFQIANARNLNEWPQVQLNNLSKPSKMRQKWLSKPCNPTVIF